MSSSKIPKKRIAIIGGGVTGLFCAYKLLENENVEFIVYEATARFGGRIFTGKFEFALQPASAQVLGPERLEWKDRFYPEYGPMRIEPEHQILLHGLLNGLGIKSAEESAGDTIAKLITFPAYASPLSDFEPEYQLSGDEKEQATPLDLLKLAFVRILGRIKLIETNNEPRSEKERAALQFRLTELLEELKLTVATRQADWSGVFQTWIDGLEEEDLENIREYAAFNSSPLIEPTPLCQMGFWNLLSDVLSYNAVIKLRDLGTFYHLLPENPNAGEWLIFWLRALKTTEKLQGIDTGMSQIVVALEASIKKRYPYSLKHNMELTSIKADGVRVKLYFNNSEDSTDEVDHVILAIPKAPLEKLALTNKSQFSDEIRHAIDAVFGFALVKVFAVVRKRWWEEDQRANVGATSIPTRELHYWKSSTPESTRGMIMIYTDRPGATFWSNYVGKTGRQEVPDEYSRGTKDDFQKSQGDRLKYKIFEVLREVGAKSLRITDIEDFGIMDWGREPYVGAAHAWRPERKSSDELRKLAAFNLTGSTKKDGGNIHVCGEAYSDYQAFIEGCLRSAFHVLHAIEPTRKMKIDESDSEGIYTVTPWLCSCRKCRSNTSREVTKRR